MPIEVAHVNSAAKRGLGMKSSDALTVSLCRSHHRESHRDKTSFATKYAIDMIELARLFYERSPFRGRLTDPG